ncbi:MAG TPA: SpoIIE family protein phosphatase [Thermoanaerobaculia bacterium]|nr:SpoIIE family protein phosphatase [Thermoanaerobaculia bacterium]
MTAREIQIVLHQPNLPPASMTLTSAQPITLGRASECTIPIKDRFLSRHHAEITFTSGQWIVRDCGSVNGTLLNGAKLLEPTPIRSGDRITLGDTEVVVGGDSAEEMLQSQIVAIDSNSAAKSMVLPMEEAIDDRATRGRERASILAELAVEFIEDRPMSELFDFILDKVSVLLQPSRCALALLGADGRTFTDVRLHRLDPNDPTDLVISRTLLGEVIEERNVISFMDVDSAMDDKLANAASIIGQQIRAAVCAPLVVNDVVSGVLYLDFLATRGAVTQDDLRLIAQIARFAAVKLETTRLREESIAKAKFEEELKTAYVIQSRLLPATLPQLDGYEFAGTNKPCRTVSGDYYDVIVRPDGRIYFVIADVSGKGITAALVMTSLATAFSIFTRNDPTPAELVRELNVTLVPKTAPTKFATLFAGLLDPSTGRVDYTNAGHVPPLVVGRDGVQQLKTTDMVIGLFPAAQYRNQSVTLAPGDSLVLFTDGVTEAENQDEEQLGLDPVAMLLTPLHGTTASALLESIEKHVQSFTSEAPAGDDVTMLALTRR